MTDPDLGDGLRQLFAALDPVPAAAVAAGHAALDWLNLDADLVVLTSEPELELPALCSRHPIVSAGSRVTPASPATGRGRGPRDTVSSSV